MEKAYLNWSGGKDSSLSLYQCQQSGDIKISKLVTTVSRKYQRISMHGVRLELLKDQADALGIPLKVVYLEESTDMQQYDRIMERTVNRLQQEGFTKVVFGDIFLEDLRKYREEKLKKSGLSVYFPLWKRDTGELMREFIDLGFKAVVVSVDASKLNQNFAGRAIDQSFIEDLPQDVDPCGENGEFHSFVFDGPIFQRPVAFRSGEKVLREYPGNPSQDWNSKFWFCDLLPN